MRELQTVLLAYGARYQPHHVEHLGAAGGFSGAQFWRLETPSGALCLRRWPSEHPQKERLEYIHRVLSRVDRAGLRIVPAPIKSLAGRTYVSSGGCLWELTPWMPGEADYWRAPSRIKLGEAMKALAGFHRAAAGLSEACFEDSIAPSVIQRRDLLNGLQHGGCRQIANAARSRKDDDESLIAPHARRILTLFPQVASQVDLQLTAASQLPVPIQPVIRDVWHDHLLFTGDAVTGLIDFGAMRNDCVSVDISRLLGSLVADDQQAWKYGLEAYQQVRPLARHEHELIGTLDSSTILLSGMNWLHWIYLDGRVFSDTAQVAERLARIAERLGNLVARGGRSILNHGEKTGFSF